jgi:hypothetical protein
MIKYLYFKPSGKYAYEGEGEEIPRALWGSRVTHDLLKEINGGKMPGIESDGKGYFVVVLDDGSWPRLVYPEDAEDLRKIMDMAFTRSAYGVPKDD